jgi:hypothetical protein
MGIEGFRVRDDTLYVHAYGKEAPIQLMGARMASAAMRDDWTETLVDTVRDTSWLAEYRRYGMNALVVFWQGSSGGWTNPTREIPPDQSARFTGNAASFCLREGTYVFEPDPAHRCHQTAFHTGQSGLEHPVVNPQVGGRMRRIIEAAAALDMVVVVGIFYFRVFQQMSAHHKAQYDFRQVARCAAEYLRGYKNILWYPYNEYHYHPRRNYGPTVTSEEAIAAEIKAVDPTWLCGGVSPALDIQMIDGHTYLFDVPSDRPLFNVETFALGAGGNDGFSGRCHRLGIWGEEGCTVETSRHNPATKNDFYREIQGALARPSYHLFAHLQGWYQGGYPGSYGHNFMGMSPGEPGGPALHDFNFYNTASPYPPVLVDDDNRGQGRWGSRGVRWYYEYLRDHYSTVKYPFFEQGAWDLRRWMDVAGA